MKIKVSEATGLVLDWMVAKCEGLTPTLHRNPYGYWVMPNIPGSYSKDWSQGGPIIEREKIGLKWEHNEAICVADIFTPPRGLLVMEGPTPLVAAMRCYCASRLGEEVEVPDELA